MDEQQQIVMSYRKLYRAMIDKDKTALDWLLADEFVLTHMTGMRQSKQAFIQAIADGTLNYYDAKHGHCDVMVNGDNATMRGRSLVSAAVFGGGLRAWRLELSFGLSRRQGRWIFTGSKASMY